MNWSDMNKNYMELFPPTSETAKPIIETPTGKKEEVEEEIIHEPIVQETINEDIEEPTTGESGEDGNN